MNLSIEEITKNLELINSTSFEKIKSTELVLILIKTYSKLYCNSKQIDFCVLCLERYYNEILKTGYKKLESMKTTLKKTNICKLKGIKYVSILHSHYDFDNLSDHDAENLIKVGWLQLEDFIILPEHLRESEDQQLNEIQLIENTTEKVPKTKKSK